MWISLAFPTSRSGGPSLPLAVAPTMVDYRHLPAEILVEAVDAVARWGLVHDWRSFQSALDSLASLLRCGAVRMGTYVCDARGRFRPMHYVSNTRGVELPTLLADMMMIKHVVERKVVLGWDSGPLPISHEVDESENAPKPNKGIDHLVFATHVRAWPDRYVVMQCASSTETCSRDWPRTGSTLLRLLLPLVANAYARVRIGQSSRTITAASLSARELEVLHCIGSGMTDGGAARLLGVAERTVRFHMDNIARKLGAANRVQAALISFAQGMICPALTEPSSTAT